MHTDTTVAQTAKAIHNVVCHSEREHDGFTDLIDAVDLFAKLKAALQRNGSKPITKLVKDKVERWLK
jgi:hypothetical protein